jgi:hypothetical protein
MRALLLSLLLVACGDNSPPADSQPDGGHGHGHRDAAVDASAVCGNGVLEGGEQCDPGGFDTVTCDADCTLALCGDGYVNAAAGEQCDGGAGCDASCHLIP